VQYNCLLQKYDKLTTDYTNVLAQSLKIKEEHIKIINDQNERDTEYISSYCFFEIKLILKLKPLSRRKKKLQKDLEEAADTTTQQDVNLKEFISNP
jgi:hypothetical protein